MDKQYLKQYLIDNDGEIFTVESIDTIRDGGTVVICTTIGKFFLNKDSKTIHTDYPPTEENKIQPIQKSFLVDKIREFIEKSEKAIEYNKNVFDSIIK